MSFLVPAYFQRLYSLLVSVSVCETTGLVDHFPDGDKNFTSTGPGAVRTELTGPNADRDALVLSEGFLLGCGRDASVCWDVWRVASVCWDVWRVIMVSVKDTVCIWRL